jgi:predicted dehydrogenase
MRRGRAVIEEGVLGRIVAMNALGWFLKPADYFNETWRRNAGGGPVLINAIHTVDDMRMLAGADIVTVQAMLSSATRGFEVEDSATVLLEFSNGALGTLNISDTVAAPWNWEMTSAENAAFPHTREACYLIGGTSASLSLPDLRLWRHAQPSWTSQITSTALDRSTEDPLVRQLQHFRKVVRREVEPLVGGRDAIATLAATLAIGSAAREGRCIRMQKV